ncbi:MAG: phosphate ABC transporter substrate-binding protein [Verrucomicrobiae bacterium]|nr:phosphate ABC transporter substrate-binding protein [Verrucomicrobiae bacterium]
MGIAFTLASCGGGGGGTEEATAPSGESTESAPAEESSPAPAGETKLVIKGSDTLGAKMVPQLAEAYKAAGHEVSFEIAAEGSSTAFTNLIAGTAEIGMSSRDIKDSEKDEFTAKGMEVKDWTAAYDMIGVIVNSSNSVTNLTLEQIEGIFTGDIKDWSEVGGAAGAISVYTRNTSSGTYKSFQEMAMNERDYGADTQKMAGNEQIAAEVGKNPAGIGYVGLAYTHAEGIKAISVNGVALDPKKAKEYPISRSLHYYTVEGKLSDGGKAFLEWATTDPAAGVVVDRVGFIVAE